MSLLVFYEIADKAAQVRDKKTYKEFERWVSTAIDKYKDAAVERQAKIQLLQLKTNLRV